MLEFAFRIDPDDTAPVYRQLESYLRSLIESGRLVQGERLPPTRELSDSLALSRKTVSHAYQRLVEDGVLAARVGQGTFVAGRPAGAASAAAESRAEGEGPDSDAAPRPAWAALFSRRARHARLPRMAAPAQPSQIRFDFLGGRVDPAQLPVRELRRAWSSAIDARMRELANPVDPFGFGPLREEIALMLVARGIACEPEDVLVTSGAQQALGLLAQTLVDPGDAVAVEQPGYFGAVEAFRAVGARIAPISVDAHGLRSDELARRLAVPFAAAGGQPQIKLVYTTPSAQAPTGVQLSGPRREALLELSERHNVPVIEDDYDSELRYESPPLPTLKTLDRSGNVVYLGTFSKALFPGLRVGYVVGDRALLSRLVRLRWSSDFGSDALAQAAVADLLASGALDRHVRRMRRTSGRRLGAMVDALCRHFPPSDDGSLDSPTWRRPQGGHHVWLRLPKTVDPDALALRAAARGIAYVRGESFSCDAERQRYRDCLALAFVNQTPEQIDEGVAELALAVAEARRPGRGGKK